MSASAQDLAKKSVALRAAGYVESGMLVGLGTGSTAAFFIEALAERRRKRGLKICAVASSKGTAERARRGGIPLLAMEQFTSLDLSVDGADEIDPEFRMIKGGGGALAREKCVAMASRERLFLVDETKCVPCLGHFGLPVEILSFGYLTTIARIERAGYQGALRKGASGKPFVTDNGNYIFDLHTPRTFPDPEGVAATLKGLVGVVETGFFFHLVTKLLIGYLDGRVEEKMHLSRQSM